MHGTINLTAVYDELHDTQRRFDNFAKSMRRDRRHRIIQAYLGADDKQSVASQYPEIIESYKQARKIQGQVIGTIRQHQEGRITQQQAYQTINELESKLPH